MTEKKAEIVHESEAQRQHVRVNLPVKASVNGKSYNVKDISAGGIQFIAVPDKYKKNDTFTCALSFPFQGFDLQTNIPCVVEFSDKEILGCAYAQLTDSQISLINLIIKSHLAGTAISEGDIIHIAGRNNFVKYRKDAGNDDTEHSTLKRGILLTLLLLAGLLGLIFIFSNLYENVSILKSYEGVVVSDVVLTRSSIDGEFRSLLDEEQINVTAGQPIAEITGYFASPNGGAISQPTEPTTITIKSPCDCVVTHQFVGNGEFRAAGESLFKLVPKESPVWITALVTPESSQRLNLQDDARIRIAGETAFIEGNVTNFNYSDDEVPVVLVRVRTKTQLPVDLIGRPAYVEFKVY